MARGISQGIQHADAQTQDPDPVIEIYKNWIIGENEGTPCALGIQISEVVIQVILPGVHDNILLSLHDDQNATRLQVQVVNQQDPRSSGDN